MSIILKIFEVQENPKWENAPKKAHKQVVFNFLSKKTGVQGERRIARVFATTHLVVIRVKSLVGGGCQLFARSWTLGEVLVGGRFNFCLNNPFMIQDCEVSF